MSVTKSLKKFNIILIVIILILLAIISILIINNNTDKVVISSKISSNSDIINSNALTMMYETEYQSGEYQVSRDTTWPHDGYTFNVELSKCENSSKLLWDDENKRVLMEANTSDKCYVYFDKEPDIIYLAEYITTQVYTGTDGENGLYLHDGTGTYGALEAGDYSYRFSGANPNNYVCFGSDKETCPADNLYRIIGVFGNQVKLIKHDYATTSLLGTNGAYSQTYEEWGIDDTYKGSIDGSLIGVYGWNNSTNVNTWSESNLNTVNLNQNYLNNIGSKWSNLIATTNWKVGGNTVENIRDAVVKTAYENEIVNPAESTTYSAKVGLMYVSDYGYTASPDNWNTILCDYDTNRNNNWIFMGLYEWIISRHSGDTGSAYLMSNTGSVFHDTARYGNAIRPTFYLNSDVILTAGTGTQSDPFRIA